MKKSIQLTFVFVAVALMSFGQVDLQDAASYMQDMEFEKAAVSIDKAVVHPKSGVKEKAWRYRGDIYMGLAMQSMSGMFNVTYFNEKGEEVVVKNANVAWMYSFNGKEGDKVSITTELVSGKKAYATIMLDKKMLVKDMASGEDVKATVSTTLTKAGEVTYVLLDPESNEMLTYLKTSIESYQKQMELDKKGSYEREVKMKLGRLQMLLSNGGIQSFNSGNYGEAYEFFSMSAEIGDGIGAIDTNSIYSAGIAANQVEKYDEAVALFKRCISYGYVPYGKTSVAELYVIASDVLKTQGKNEDFIALIKEGRVAYPGSEELIVAELNFYLENGNTEEALANLQLAIDKDPSNPIYYFVLGTVYEKYAAPIDAEGKELSLPENHDEFVTKALGAYASAVEVDGKYFDAIYNLGALHVNEGIRLSQELESITGDAKQKEVKAIADNHFCEGMVWLEKALALNQDDEITVATLKQLYARVEMNVRWKMMSDKLKNATPIDMSALKAVDTENSCVK